MTYIPQKSYRTKRERNEILRTQMDQERASWVTHWRDLGDHILPNRPRFFLTENDRGGRRNQKIVDSTATQGANTIRSGMMSGNTSPARPWFRLTVADPDLAENPEVKDWLHVVSLRMATVYIRSNLYDSLQEFYGDAPVFGTAPMMIEEDFERTIHCTVFPIGSYMIANDRRRKVRVFFREFRMTIRQMLEEFGERNAKGEITNWGSFSNYVREQYDSRRFEAWVDICHVIAPNDDQDDQRFEARFKPYSSCYYEKGTYSGKLEGSYIKAGVDDDRYLRLSGYDYFPVLVLRWSLSGDDVYGTDCPGMTALGDIRALQLMHKRKAQALDILVRPPMMAPSELRTKTVSIVPGDITYVDSPNAIAGLKPIYQIEPKIKELVEDIVDHRERINRAFHVDLFRMFSSIQDREMTATEIAERQQEKLLALGPVLERVNSDVLDPLIDITFDLMLAQGMIPEPPEALAGVELKVEYISIMAQAQKAVGLASLRSFMDFVLAAAEASPQLLDKVDFDQLIDEYAEMVGIPPRVVRSDEAAAQIREARARLQANQAAIEAAKPVASAAKDLAQADVEKDSMLKRLLASARAGQLVETEA